MARFVSQPWVPLRETHIRPGAVRLGDSEIDIRPDANQGTKQNCDYLSAPIPDLKSDPTISPPEAVPFPVPDSKTVAAAGLR